MGLAEEMLKRHDKLHLELTQSKARIRELEDVLGGVREYLKQKETPRHIIDIYIENALSEKSDKEDDG